MADVIPLLLDTSGPTNVLRRAAPTDDLAGFEDLKPTGTTDGVDVSADAATQAAHLAAAAPHSGHATTAAAAAAQTSADAAQADADAAQADIDAHEGASAPHAGHATTGALAALDAAAEKLANKGQVGGYAGLNGAGLVPIAQLATGTPTGAKFLRDDNVLAVPPGGGGGGGNVVGAGTSAVGQVPAINDTATSSIVPTPVTINPATGDMAGARDITLRHLLPSGTVDGRDVSVDGAALDAHTAAAAPHSGHATTAAVSTAQATATAAQADIDAHEVAGAPHAGHEVLTNRDVPNGYPSLGSDGLLNPTRYAKARARNVRVTRGLIEYMPPLLRARASILRPRNHYYGDESTGTDSSSGHRAGLIAIAPNNAGVSGGPIHPDAGSFPYINPDCSIDFNGYPNYRFKRFHSSNAGQDSGSDGYESGRRIPAGYLLRGQGQRRTFVGKLKNTTLDNAFFEFVIEPNHRRGVFSATSRARLASGPLGFHWTGWADLLAVVDFTYQAGAVWQARAQYSLVLPTGELAFERTARANVTAGHNFQTTACENLVYHFQVSTWDLYASPTTYTAQGTGGLELVLCASATEPLEACR